jgi:hypothetical protein
MLSILQTTATQGLASKGSSNFCGCFHRFQGFEQIEVVEANVAAVQTEGT